MCRAHLHSCVLKKKKRHGRYFFYLSVFMLGDFPYPLEIHLLSEEKGRGVFYIFNRRTCSHFFYSGSVIWRLWKTKMPTRHKWTVWCWPNCRDSDSSPGAQFCSHPGCRFHLWRTVGKPIRSVVIVPPSLSNPPQNWRVSPESLMLGPSLGTLLTVLHLELVDLNHGRTWSGKMQISLGSFAKLIYELKKSSLLIPVLLLEIQCNDPRFLSVAWRQMF